MIKRFSILALALSLSGCALHRLPTAQPVHPNEMHVLAETQRFAEWLGIGVRGVITTKPYMVPASRPLYDGEKVPASGRYVYGRIEYYRPIIQERTQEWASWLAAHEVAHVFYNDHKANDKTTEDRADLCALHLMSGEKCQ